MSNHHYRRVVRSLVTAIVLLTTVVTTFAPDWMTSAQAAPVANDTASDLNNSATPTDNTESVPDSPTAPQGLAPLNALVLPEPGQAEALQTAINEAGGYVYVRQDDALFVGLDTLTYSDLAPMGARMLYQGTVSANDLAALNDEDRAAAVVWNEMQTTDALSPDVVGTAMDTKAYLGDTLAGPNSSPALAADQPGEEDTSTFLYGSVSVNVVFVESTAATTADENWTLDEINKVKAEITNALDWWAVAATAPESYGGEPRPSANLSWNVKYFTPLDGTVAERNKVKLPVEPIQGCIQPVSGCSVIGTAWMADIAGRYVPAGTPTTQAIVSWAHQTRIANNTDWAFVLYVVDGSKANSGKFLKDGMAAGAKLAGPWAVVTNGAGDYGINNLEAYIAKMVGHVFGAGDEAYDSDTGAGCRPEEYYGYLLVKHDNCEKNLSARPSIMRSPENMLMAYREYSLSPQARAQVGWVDEKPSTFIDGELIVGNGVYDVVDTLDQVFPGFSSSNKPVCPILHLMGIPIVNVASTPGDTLGYPEPNKWATKRWNGTQIVNGVVYHPVNINYPSFVWGRINDGDWVAGSASDGFFNAGDDDEKYNLPLVGNSGQVNRVEVVLMNRWDNEAYRMEPQNIEFAAPYKLSSEPDSPEVDNSVESDEANWVDLFDPYGTLNASSDIGWLSDSSKPDYYHAGSTMVTIATSLPGREACFAFEGTEATLYYNNDVVGVAEVMVDNKLHSTITFTGTAGATEYPKSHIISNLPSGIHSISVKQKSGQIDFDAFELTDPTSNYLINAITEPGPQGIYEHSQLKIRYVGDWTNQTMTGAVRPGTVDNAVKRSSTAYNRFYATFTGADTVAVYRLISPAGGSADIYLEGKYWGTMYNKATTTSISPFYISGLASNVTYTLEVRVNPAAAGAVVPNFDLDTLRFMNLRIDPTVNLYKVSVPLPGDPMPAPLEVAYNGDQERYGVWLNKITYLSSRNEGDILTVYFQGSAIAVNRGTSTAGGMMEIYVDGQLKRTVDNLTAATTLDTAVIVHGLDPNFPHVLQVRIINRATNVLRYNNIYGYTVFYVDPVGVGSYEEYEYNASGTPVRSDFIYEQLWNKPILYTKEPGPSGDRYITSKHQDARVYLYFTGADSLTLYGVTGAFGRADIYVNGELKGEFLQRGVVGYNKPFTVTGFDRTAVNVLEIRSGVGAGLVRLFSLDRVVVYNRPLLGSGIYENNGTINLGGGLGEAPALQFSGQWNEVTDAKAHGDGVHGTTFHTVVAKGDTVSFDVKDTTSIIVYRRLYRTYGMADVYVDGALYTSFDNYDPITTTGQYQQPYVIAGLDVGFNHHIVIKPRLLSAAGAFKPFDIDYIEVRNTDASGFDYLVDGYYANNDASVMGKAVRYQGTKWTHGTESVDTTRGERVMISFFGHGFSIFFNRRAGMGTANIYVDGQLYGTAKTVSTTKINAVPYSVGGLKKAYHMIEIIVTLGPIAIDGYQVYGADPDSELAVYDLVTGTAPNQTINQYVMLSGLWTINGEYLQTRELDASAYIYVRDGNKDDGLSDTVFLTRDTIDTSGPIEIHVNNVRTNTVDNTYLKTITGDETFEASGLGDTLSRKTYIRIRNPQALLISLKMVRIGNLTPTLDAQLCTSEAEAVDKVHRAGNWTKLPTAANTKLYSGGFYMQSFNANSRFYIPVKDVTYVIINRLTGTAYGDSDVYIDGQYWGKMTNRAAVAKMAPFPIGPITSGMHTIELRQTTPTLKFAIDSISCQSMNTLLPGYYEDTDPNLSYTGTWVTLNNLAGASANGLHEARSVGAKMAAVFDGNMVKIYRRVSTATKNMTITIDGTAYMVNNYSAKILYRVPYTILLPDTGIHTLELSAVSGYADFDAIEIGQAVPATFGAYQEDDPLIAVNNTEYQWKSTASATVHSGGAYAQTNIINSNMFFLFYGQRVTTYLTKGRTWGIAKFLLDGELKGELDLYYYDAKNVADVPFVTYDLPSLAPGNHVLEVRFEGKKSKGAAKINVDAFTVNGAPVPKPGQHNGPSEPDTGGGGGNENLNVPREGCFEESNAEWVRVPNEPESFWFPFTDPGASMDLYVESPETGDEIYAEFDFAATGFTLLYHRNWTGGQADIYLDGVLLTTLSMKTASPADPPLWLEEASYSNPTPLDPNKVHVLKIVKVPNTSGKIYIDRLDLPTYDEAYNDNCIVMPK
ncbi:MAG TPA: hypothetical protein VHP83_11955 [Aggregatilineaceae bacterium]|nr:hypothetical protein [Aggregatilineaceae bacterium]